MFLIGLYEWFGLYAPAKIPASTIAQTTTPVIRAKAGIQCPNLPDITWIPAFAGMTDFYMF